MMTPETRAFFVEALKYFSVPSNHCTRYYARNADGTWVSTHDEQACSRCIVGYLHFKGRESFVALTDPDEAFILLMEALARHTPPDMEDNYLVGVNDGYRHIIDEAGNELHGQPAIVFLIQSVLGAHPVAAAA